MTVTLEDINDALGMVGVLYRGGVTQEAERAAYETVTDVLREVARSLPRALNAAEEEE